MNGKVLIAGGNTSANIFQEVVSASAELYDPSTRTFTSTGTMGTARLGHSATLLTNGKVLIAGGQGSGGNLLSSAEVYDPATGAFTPTGNLLEPQDFQTATLLPRGQVLLARGFTQRLVAGSTFDAVAGAELYDPAQGTFSFAGTFSGDCGFCAGTSPLLPNGEVLVVVEPTAQLYDPLQKAFSATGAPLLPGHTTATLLATGKVLLAGGESDATGIYARSEIYDPNTHLLTLSGQMACVRSEHTSTLLADGTVLIAGGESDNCGFGPIRASTAQAELYDPATGFFGGARSLITPREGHTATLLHDGSVLIAGGITFLYNPTVIDKADQTLATAELYLPAGSGPPKVTIATVPSGLKIVVDGAAFLSPQTFSWVPGTSHSIFANPDVPAGTRYVFNGWSDGGTQSHAVTVGASDASYTASFSRLYQLTTSVSPAGSGTITVNPPSPDQYYSEGAILALTAVSGSGGQFQGWGGDLSGTQNPQPVVMTGPRNATASFRGGCAYSLSAGGAAAGLPASTGSFDVIAGPGCPWTAASSAPWVIITSAASGVGSGTVRYSVATNSGLMRAAVITAAGQTFTITQTGLSVPAPTPGSVSPAWTNAATQTISFAFSDPRGWQDLGVVDILINNFLDASRACYLAYVQASNLLVLVDDTGAAGGPYAGRMVLDGSAGTIENSQCRIDGSASSRNGSGQTLTLTLSITLKSGFAGNRIVYVAARDQLENSSGWQAMGAWQAPGSPVGVITAAAVAPMHSVGTAQSFTFTISDTKGAADIGIVDVLVNDFLDGSHGCYLAYAARSKLLLLVDDVGDAGGPFAGALTLGDPGTIRNAQCTVGLVSATEQGNVLTLVVNVSYPIGFDGGRVLYMAARDVLDGNNTGWQALGTWNMP